MNFSMPYTDPVNLASTKVRVPIYLCPSEINDRERVDGTVIHYPLNYGANVGVWFVFDPNSSTSGRGRVPGQAPAVRRPSWSRAATAWRPSSTGRATRSGSPR